MPAIHFLTTMTRCTAFFALVLAATPLHADENSCGSLENAYGPFDYRVHKGKPAINIVDKYHFTPLVENLIKPMFQHFSADFDYTLRAVPNHHRALISMLRWTEKQKNPQPPGAQYSVDCYFDRALRFAPDDVIVRMVFAEHLIHTDRKPLALEQLDYVASKADDNAFTHFNVGMLYVQLPDYAKALHAAHSAQALGLKKPELRSKLSAAGKWVEPTDPAVPVPEPAASKP